MSGVVINGKRPSLNVSSSAQWMEIQRNTFKNWVNEQLKSRGLSIFDLRTDFDDGTLLVALIELIQRKRVPGVVQKPSHNHEKLHNITIALDAIANDNVTIINIDSKDIMEGNTKLILALIWQLVLRYQIGLSNFQHRSWLLAWVQAVIPECHVTNLTTDWNSGVALHALLEFCKPGLAPDWKSLNPLDRVNNCREGMKLARQHFGIPLVLRPEDLANSNLDELSSITYLSYFTKVGAPGYNATLQRVQPLIRNYPVFNFTTDWNDGRVLCELVYVFGGPIPTWPDLKGTSMERLQEGIDGAVALGINQLLSASEISDEKQEHLGIMAYAARFLTLSSGIISYEHSYKETKIVTVEDSIPSRTSTMERSQNNGMDLPDREVASASPLSFADCQQLEYTLVRTPSLRRKQRQQLQEASEGVKKDTYSDGVIIYATSHEVVTPDDVQLEAESPTGRVIKMNGDGMYHAQFGPEEIGVWGVTLMVQGKLVDRCQVKVCDPSQVKVTGLKAGMTGNPHKFSVDCSGAGEGKLECDINLDDRPVPCFVNHRGGGHYVVSFTPVMAGNYKISINYNKAEIRDDAISEELHRQAVFSTNMKPHHDHYKITASCDWQIDYMTGGPIDLFIGDTVDIRVYSMQDGTICNIPHLIADLSQAPGDGEVRAEVSYGSSRFPAEVVPDKPSTYRILFNPRGPGTYKVWITYNNRLVKGSPFLQEIAELTSPQVEGPGLIKGRTAEPAEFTVDARGFPGEVAIDVQGPHFPINSNVSTNPDGTNTVTYIPEEVGIHRIHLKLNGKDIKGSPYHPKIVDPSQVRVSGGWGPLMDGQERIPLVVGKEKHIPFDASHAGPGELTSNVHGPSDKVPVTIDARGDGKHSLIFTPKEEGKHYIDVFWNGYSLPKSPFIGYATPAQEEPDVFIPRQEPVRVKQVQRVPSARNHEPPPGYFVKYGKGPGYENGPTKVYVLAPGKREPEYEPRSMYPPTRVSVYRHGSDVGSHNKPRHYLPPKRSGSNYSNSTLSVRSEPRVKGPDVVITRLPRSSPSYYMDPPNNDSFVYSTSPLSSSPPSVSPSYIYAQPKRSPPSDKGASPKVVLKGRGLKEAELDKPAVFHIDGRNAGPVGSVQTGITFLCGADRHVSFDDESLLDISSIYDGGEPEAKISSIRSEPPVEIKPIGPKQYKCTYVPRVPGAYLLDIKWNNKPLKCCPFKVNVKKPVYPEKVGVTGNLKQGEIGKDISLNIDPREAGKGELEIDCKDPENKDVPVHLKDNYDGTYRLRVKPEKPGKHILNIRLNKQHVFGSPYAIEIKGQPLRRSTLGNVKVYGPGLKNGVFPDYQGHFFVDATGAGGGELHVSVMGLKGAFHVEMKRASQKDKLFNCLYHPLEPGVYQINVQWSGNHVRGSPFKVFVAGSEMELLEFESGQSGEASFSSSKKSPNTTENSIMY